MVRIQAYVKPSYVLIVSLGVSRSCCLHFIHVFFDLQFRFRFLVEVVLFGLVYWCFGVGLSLFCMKISTFAHIHTPIQFLRFHWLTQTIKALVILSKYVTVRQIQTDRSSLLVCICCRCAKNCRRLSASTSSSFIQQKAFEFSLNNLCSLFANIYNFPSK